MSCRATVALLLLAALATACRTPEEKLVDRRHELRELLDGLYATYGGSDLAKEVRGEAAGDEEVARERGERGARGQDDEAEPQGAGLVGRLVTEMDRSLFEQSCLDLGRGGRPFVLSDKLAAFLAEPDHAADCRKAARLRAEVDALEREVEQDAGPRARP
jgi:hypothetical protein